ncbi:MAG: phosphate acyltransferase PlsX [Opitutae bacterium]|nr:phosphate acyltransferase PlsX [Opitutae bacterium]
MKTGALAIDAMGGDRGPSEVVDGIALAYEANQVPERLIVVGREEILTPLLQAKGLTGKDFLSVHHAEEVIGMDEKPTDTLRRKRNSSMLQGIELVKEDRAQAILSCGNTGSLMAGGTVRLRPLDGIERPALATVMPGTRRNGKWCLLDAGANPDSKPEQLVHNAILGSQYMNAAHNVSQPKVGLLSIGTEEGKGGQRIKETHNLLQSIGTIINYHGLIEGFQVYNDVVDVVVCDGFVGNILLKGSESLFHAILNILKEEIEETPMRKAGALLAKGAFKGMKSRLNPEEFGAAPLLGLKGHVLKAHGSSNCFSFASAIKIAKELLQYDVIDGISKDLEKSNVILQRIKESNATPAT